MANGEWRMGRTVRQPAEEKPQGEFLRYKSILDKVFSKSRNDFVENFIRLTGSPYGNQLDITACKHSTFAGAKNLTTPYFHQTPP